MHHSALQRRWRPPTLGSLIQRADATQGATANSRHWFDSRVPFVTYEVAEGEGHLSAIAKTPAKAWFHFGELVL
jgi:hypothetical protein